VPALAELFHDLVADRADRALQYGSAHGDEALRERICDVMALEGIAAEPDDVVVTVGSQQALDLVARVFLDPGDIVLTEAPTYVTALGTFGSNQARVVHVPMDSDGLIPAALAEMLARLPAPPKLLYTVPTFHNPTGVTLSEARRTEVVEICRRAGVAIVEDNPYGLLAFDGLPRRALRADAADCVLYLGSFSKTFAPGLRVGWVLAPPAVRDTLVLAAESAMLSHSNLAQMAVERYLATQPWQAQLAAFRDVYRTRCDLMLDALDEQGLPTGVSWTRPRGGFFVWVSLGPGLDAKQMLPHALERGVAYVPGTGFYADGRGRHCLRLSFCYPPLPDIGAGIHRLAAVVHELARDGIEKGSCDNGYAYPAAAALSDVPAHLLRRKVLDQPLDESGTTGRRPSGDGAVAVANGGVPRPGP
jgi:2-aminoadipate transaminase